ncbi:ergosterol biosynthetic protein 28, partial [Teratosphaeria destructans]
MDTLTSYLPPTPGLLPQWLLLISLVSLGNSIQAYISPAGTRQVYANHARADPRHPSQVTPLAAR